MKPVGYAVIFGLSLLMGGCANALNQQATLVSMENGVSVYSTQGLVLLRKVEDGASKPYAEQGLANACPAGLNYRSYTESVNRVTPFGTWIMWEGLVSCK